MKTIEEIVNYLQNYHGRRLRIMEVCGSHTAAITKCGIRELLSERISLISGPGCPVCVTPSSYIDRLIELAKEPDTTVVTFGDMLRVPGSRKSLSEAKGEGASVEMVYSPMDTLKLAKKNPQRTYIFAAVGFETTAPVYTLLLDEVYKEGIKNVKLLTALKTMPRAIRSLMAENPDIDGFLAPGHVCTITGSKVFQPLAEKLQIPFAVAGFGDRELVLAIYGLVRMIEKQEMAVKNFYPAAVTEEGNRTAQEKMKQYFKPYDALWRGLGVIPESGLILRDEYQELDAGSKALIADEKRNPACCCDKILIGKMLPAECPLFGKVCTPGNPQGACMVSYEGSCHQQYGNGGWNG